MRINIKLLLILFFSIFLFTACFDGRVESIKTVKQNSKIKITLKRSQSDVFNIKLKDEQKVLILTFFTTNCGACKEEIPSLNMIEKEFSTKVKVVSVLGEKINTKKTLSFIKEHQISYDIVSDTLSVNLLSKAVGKVFGVPVTFIFDKRGKLFKKFSGLIPHRIMRQTILQAIE